MRAPTLPTLIVVATFVGCTFMLIILNGSNRQHHITRLAVQNGHSGYAKYSQNIHHRFVDGKERPVTEGSQSDKLSVFDAASMQMGNLSDLQSNHSNKVPIIQEKTAQAEEKKDSLAIFFILLIIVLAILIVHAILVTEFRYMPESLAIVLLGALIGFVLSYSRWDWREVESFNPNFFFLVLLPPIIFESGYTVNKGNFFTNIIPIFTFAIFGTVITALVMSLGIYGLGMVGIIYRLSLVESIVFGSILAAIDPVITLAIFQALKVNPQLYIMTFGESMLNDAIAIVLASTALEMNSVDISHLTTLGICRYATYRFLSMFFVSAILGWGIGIISSLIYKHVHLRKTPALEMALLLVFAYLPYGLAEALSLSGIMAILFCAITMSQYTHFNLTPVTQLTMQMTFRTLSFVAETCTFAYLGLALFSIKLVFQPMFLLCSIILIFVSRAANIFPLSFLVNKCIQNKISFKNQIIMWFSGMRGAVAFALALHMDVQNIENKQMMLTSTLFVVLFTIIFMGGTALPLIKVLDGLFPDVEEVNEKHDHTRKGLRHADETHSTTRSRKIVLSKTQEMNIMDHAEYIADHYETNDTLHHHFKTQSHHVRKNFFTRLNEQIVRPLLIRSISKEEIQENKLRLRQMTEALRVDFLDDLAHHSIICAHDDDECLRGDRKLLLPSTSSPR